MQRSLSALELGIILLLSMAPGCKNSEVQSNTAEIGTTSKALPTGPVISRVGSVDLKLSEVDELAAMASEIRQRPPWNLPPPPMDTFDQRMRLAIEFLSLVGAAQKGYLEKSLVSDSMKRALASVYLRRALLMDLRRPVTKEELEQAHQDEIRKYITTGESELYRPTRVDFAIIGVGINPAWTKYEKGTVKNPMTMEQTVALASKIKKLAGDHVPDLDKFEALAKKFKKGNPTVRIKHQKRAALAKELFPLAPVFYDRLVKLKNNGDISPVFRTPAGAMILRRGVTWPGKGENAEEIKNELTSRVQQKWAMEHLRKISETLKKNYAIETYPDALGPVKKTEKHK